MEDKKNKKDTNNSASSTSLSTMLLQGLEAPAKLVKLYQVNAWPQDSDVSNLSPDVMINLMGDVRQGFLYIWMLYSSNLSFPKYVWVDRIKT